MTGDDMTSDETETPGLNYGRLYEFRFKDVDQDARQRVWNEIASYLWNRMGRPKRVLDPAGGRGEFVNAVPAEERWLVDMVDYPERQTDPGVKIVIGNLLDIELPPAYFDAVFASNLLEHFHSPEEVAQFLDRMRETLAPGGVLALMGPNFKYCANEYFDCADHLLVLTHVSVQELLFASGYKVTEVVPRFLPFSFRSRLPAWPVLTRLLSALAGALAAPGEAVPDPRHPRISVQPAFTWPFRSANPLVQSSVSRRVGTGRRGVGPKHEQVVLARCCDCRRLWPCGAAAGSRARGRRFLRDPVRSWMPTRSIPSARARCPSPSATPTPCCSG